MAALTKTPNDTKVRHKVTYYIDSKTATIIGNFLRDTILQSGLTVNQVDKAIPWSGQLYHFTNYPDTKGITYGHTRWQRCIACVVRECRKAYLAAKGLEAYHRMLEKSYEMQDLVAVTMEKRR